MQRRWLWALRRLDRVFMHNRALAGRTFHVRGHFLRPARARPFSHS